MTVPKPARLRVDHLPTVCPNAAGLDIGSAEIVAALPPDRDVTVVRTFTTFTADLRQLVTHNRAGQALRQAAQSCSRSHSIFGALYRARRARSSSEEAVVATAHTIARVMYHMLTCHEAFKPESIRAFDQKRPQREVKHLQKRAKALGFTLQPVTV